MLEWLAAATGVELGKLVLEQVLNLGKAALEDYVKDFFKDCVKSGVAQANAETLKKPMAEAIGCFIKRFIKELQFNDVLETSIEHHYKASIKRFVQDKAVRPILGKAFEKDCKQIDYDQLQEIWTQQYQVEGWQFPAEEFDWRGVAKEYVVEVKDIIKSNGELRALLAIDLQEQQAESLKQIAGINPGFDVVQYRDSLQCSYGYLKLYTLDSTDRADTIKLWSMFIEQTVREALPPMRYELPLDLKRQLQEQGQLEDLSPEALEHYRHEYFQQPTRKVLKAVADSRCAVILGDPGAGKSTLLQYLALEWVEGKTETLPLLIELREYVLARSPNFLDFLHQGSGADWQFDQQQLHQHLLENPTLVMFDGLDEVFDRPTQSTVIDDIIRFAQQYPKARVLVTSRIIGYSPERFQHAGFHQFTIQSLDETEIHEFIDRWYDLAMGSDADRTRLKQRLKDAIANSKAIQNLADNLLLLTMMAILNRRQELPRDRADLYDQASRVLLYHWDVDHKRLQLPMDAIGRREKQEMLRLIAYEMQAGEEGLKGNLIGVDRLTRILTDYLRDQGFGEPREKANLLIQQLRERNFILCYRGADSYGFVHRTFLEYFCAVEIVNRFEKVRSISFEQLRDEIFGQHWQDKTWHEVLRLIGGMIDERFAGEIINYLIDKGAEIDYQDEEVEAPLHLELAGNLLSEIKNRSAIEQVANKLLSCLKYIAENTPFAFMVFPIIAKNWYGDQVIFSWFIDFTKSDQFDLERRDALEILVAYWKHQPNVLNIVKGCAEFDRDESLRQAATQLLVHEWIDDLDTLDILINRVQSDTSYLVRQSVMDLADYWHDKPNIFSIVKNCTESDESAHIRWLALRGLVRNWSNESITFDFLESRAINDPFKRKAPHEYNPRRTALEGLLTHYSTHPKTIELLHDRAINDHDGQLREWAQQKLTEWENDRDG